MLAPVRQAWAALDVQRLPALQVSQLEPQAQLDQQAQQLSEALQVSGASRSLTSEKACLEWLSSLIEPNRRV